MLLLMQECYKLSIPIIAPVQYYEHRLKSKGVGMKYFRAAVVNYLIPGTYVVIYHIYSNRSLPPINAGLLLKPGLSPQEPEINACLF